MKAYLNRRYRFSASHRLHSEQMSDAENQATYGKCNNPHGHGHNYVLEVTVSGQVDESTGMVCKLVDLDDCVAARNCHPLRSGESQYKAGIRRFRPHHGKPLPWSVYDILKREFSLRLIWKRYGWEETMMSLKSAFSR